MKFKFKLFESLSTSKDKELEYDDLTVQIDLGTDYQYGPQWDEEEINWTYHVSEEDCAELLKDKFIDSLSDEEYLKMEASTTPNEDVFEKYVEEHFDDLFNKYYEDLLEYFRDDAERDASENWEPYTPDYDDIGD